MKCFKAYFSKIDTRLDPVFVWANSKPQKTSKFPLYKIADLSSSFTGGTPSKFNKDYWRGDIAWVSPKDFIDFYIYDSQDHINQQAIKDSSTKLIPENALLIVFRSGILKHTLPVAITKKALTINQDIKALVFNKKIKIMSEYVGYYLIVFQNEILPLIVKHSTTVQSVNSEQFNHLEIPVPPIEIQNQIVNSMNISIANKKQKLQQAKELLGSIDKYVLSELGIELPELKDKTCFIVRASEVKGSRLDPKCYSKIKKNIINSINGSNYKKDLLKNLISKSLSGEWGCSPEEELNCESILCKVIRNVNFDNDFNLNLDIIAERKIPVRKYNNAKLEGGDILIEKSGGSPTQPVGRVAIIEQEYGDFFYSNFLQLIKIKKNICLPEYLFCVLKTFYRLNLMEYLQNQTTGIKNLIFEEYLEIPIPIPTLPIQQKIADEVKSRMDKAKQLQIEAIQAVEQAKKEVEKMILGEMVS